MKLTKQNPPGARLVRKGTPLQLDGPFWVKMATGRKLISGPFDTLRQALENLCKQVGVDDLVIETEVQMLDPYDPQEQARYGFKMPSIITKEIALAAGYRQEFYHRLQRNRDGTAVQARVNGKCQTWLSKPNDWRLPMKHGFKQAFQLGTSAACHQDPQDWLTLDPTNLTNQ